MAGVVRRYDVVLAADCVFFRTFHRDLLWLLRSSLRRGGRALLLQPHRGDSLDAFVSLVRAEAPDLIVDIVYDFDAKVCDEEYDV